MCAQKHRTALTNDQYGSPYNSQYNSQYDGTNHVSFHHHHHHHQKKKKQKKKKTRTPQSLQILETVSCWECEQRQNKRDLMLEHERRSRRRQEEEEENIGEEDFGDQDKVTNQGEHDKATGEQPQYFDPQSVNLNENPRVDANSANSSSSSSSSHLQLRNAIEYVSTLNKGQRIEIGYKDGMKYWVRVKKVMHPPMSLFSLDMLLEEILSLLEEDNQDIEPTKKQTKKQKKVKKQKQKHQNDIEKEKTLKEGNYHVVVQYDNDRSKESIPYHFFLLRIVSPESGTWIEQPQEWAQCVQCHKWRKLQQGVDAASLPEIWTCTHNIGSHYNHCDIPEETASGTNIIATIPKTTSLNDDVDLDAETMKKMTKKKMTKKKISKKKVATNNYSSHNSGTRNTRSNNSFTSISISGGVSQSVNMNGHVNVNVNDRRSRLRKRQLQPNTTPNNTSNHSRIANTHNSSNITNISSISAPSDTGASMHSIELDDNVPLEIPAMYSEVVFSSRNHRHVHSGMPSMPTCSMFGDGVVEEDSDMALEHWDLFEE